MNFAKFLRTHFYRTSLGDYSSNYEQLIMDCFDSIFTSTEDLAYFFMNFLTGFMISLCLAAPSLWVWSAWNLMGTSVWNRQKFFISFENKYYFIQSELKYSCYSNLFGNVFQTSGVIGLIALRYAKLRSWKCYGMRNFDPENVFHFFSDIWFKTRFS